MEDEPSQEVSQYNEAALQIMRLHEFWVQSEHYSNKGILIKWKFILDSIYRELFSDIQRMSPGDSNEIKKRNKEIMEKIINAKTSSELYAALDNRHRFLKELQDTVGKGSRYGDVDTESFD